MKAQFFFVPNFSFHNGYEQFAKFFARQIFPLYSMLGIPWGTVFMVCWKVVVADAGPKGKQ